MGKVVVYVENPDKTANPAFVERKDLSDQQLQGLSDVIDYAANPAGDMAGAAHGPGCVRWVAGNHCYTPVGDDPSPSYSMARGQLENCPHFAVLLWAGDVVMISKELADYNKLSVGDIMTMYCLDSDSNVKLEIVGIFDGTEGTSGNGGFSVSDIPANCGYVDYTSMFENFGRKIDGYTQVDIYVKDPVCIQNIYDKISSLPELHGKSLKLSIDTDEYEVVQAPLETLQGLWIWVRRFSCIADIGSYLFL